MGNAKTRREAAKLFYWAIKTLFSKDGALISLRELEWILRNVWEELHEDGYFVLESEIEQQ